MKLVLAACVALLAVILLRAEDEMGPPDLPDGTRIANGIPAAPRQFPYMAYVRSTDDSGESVRECGGSLITRLAVLTAAWCVDEQTKYTLRLGSIYRNGEDMNGWTVVSTWAMMHPKYNRSSADYHVAIIHLPKEAPLNAFIQPVHLPSSPDIISYVGCKGIVAGWGETFPGSRMSDVLHWAEVVVIPNEYCKKVFNSTAITDRQVCAGSVSSTVLGGDGGAPLVLKTGGRYMQIAVFNRIAPDSYNTSKPATYTRVTSIIDWIQLLTESDQ